MTMRLSRSKRSALLSFVQAAFLVSPVRVDASGLRSPNGLVTAFALHGPPVGQRRPPAIVPTRIPSVAPADAENRPQRIISRPVVDEQQSLVSLSKCTVTLTEPTTRCEVVLVGCFHGSPASAQDVAATLSKNPPDALALELCPDRFVTIREQAQDVASRAKPIEPSRQPTWSFRRGDWTLRGVDGLLRFVSQAQSTFFSGLEPGLEFVTAVRTCPHTKIVLADQPVQETLYKLSRLPSGHPRMADNRHCSNRASSPLQETSALLSALFGCGEVRARGYKPLNLFEFGMRTRQAQAELVQSVVLPLLLCVGTVLSLPTLVATRRVLDNAVQTNGPDIEFAVRHFLESDHASLLHPPLVVIAINAALVVAFYVGLVVPVVRVVLSERDDCLARGIRAACRVASADDGDGEVCGDPKVRRVTAVLGLLHVNGVAQRLLRGDEENPGLN